MMLTRLSDSSGWARWCCDTPSTVAKGKALRSERQVFPSNDGTEYYIIDGLKPGDEIVTNGVRKLSNGVSVR